MLGQRRRRWANIELTLVQRPVFAGIHLKFRDHGDGKQIGGFIRGM